MNIALVIVLAFSCIIAISAYDDSAKCKSCSASPKKEICATNELGENKTFCNLCEMVKFNCTNKTSKF